MAITNISSTDSKFFFGGYWRRNPFGGPLAGQNTYHATGSGAQFDIAFNIDATTDIEIFCYPNSTNPIEISIDGGSFTTPTMASGSAFGLYSIVSSLSSGNHTLSVRAKNLSDFFLAETNTLKFTGGNVTLSVAATFGPRYALTESPQTTYVKAEPNVPTANFGQPEYYPSTNLSSFRFRATTSSLKIWTYFEGAYLTLRVDGVDTGIAFQIPNLSRWGWFTVATGLDDTTEHEYVITCTTQFFHISYIMLSGASAALNVSTTPPARLFVAGYGDSISTNVFWPDYSNGYIYRITKQGGGQTFIGHSDGYGGAVVGGGSGNAGKNRTANITGLTRKPDYLIIEFGSNDAYVGTNLTTFQTDYESMLTSFVSGLATTEIYCLGILPRNDTAWATCQNYNAKIQAAIAANGSSRLHYIDPSSWYLAGVPFQSGGTFVDTNYNGDKTHQNELGMEIIADNIYTIIAPPDVTAPSVPTGITAESVYTLRFNLPSLTGDTAGHLVKLDGGSAVDFEDAEFVELEDIDAGVQHYIEVAAYDSAIPTPNVSAYSSPIYGTVQAGRPSRISLSGGMN